MKTEDELVLLNLAEEQPNVIRKARTTKQMDGQQEGFPSFQVEFCFEEENACDQQLMSIQVEEDSLYRQQVKDHLQDGGCLSADTYG